MNEENLTAEQREVLRQKNVILESGGYTPIPHEIYREVLPSLVSKYDGQTARDCLTLYMYLHAHVNGETGKDAYLWAFPTVKQMREDTGIHGDRIKKLVDILVDEGLLETRLVPWKGNVKKMYMPFYFSDSYKRETSDSRIRETSESHRRECNKNNITRTI